MVVSQRRRRESSLEMEMKCNTGQRENTNFYFQFGLHGLRHIFGTQRRFFERVVWLLIYTAGVLAAACLLLATLLRFKNSSIILIQSTSQVALEQIPFPGVTVCGMNQVKQSQFQAYEKIVENQHNTKSDMANHALSALQLLEYFCNSSKSFSKQVIGKLELFGVNPMQVLLTLERNYNNLNNPQLANLLLEGAPNCTDLIRLCIWNDKHLPCSHLFHRVETDFGICCAFNSVPVSVLRPDRDTYNKYASDRDWQLANLNSDNLLFEKETNTNQPYPYRQQRAGKSQGLSIVLDASTYDNYCNNDDSQGFLIAINSPLDYPGIRDNGILIGRNAEVLIAAQPKIILADQLIKYLHHPEKRKCYFHNENKLANFSIYTKLNCLDECLENLTTKYCSFIAGCSYQWNLRHLCHDQLPNCTKDVARQVIQTRLGDFCKHCYPTCSEITYRTKKTSQSITQAYTDNLVEKFSTALNGIKSNISIVHMFFNEQSVHPSVRVEQFGITDLLSSIGGILGLCLGFTGITMVEIVYCVILKVFCDRRQENDFYHEEETTIVSESNDCESEMMEHA